MIEPLLCDLSVTGRQGIRFPEPDVPLADCPICCVKIYPCQSFQR